MTMKKGEIAKLTIAGHKGYGAKGFPAWGYPFLIFIYHISEYSCT